jgi:hypothetical protein
MNETFSLQLWNNVRTAYGDQPDLVELAETLSQNFESLYEKEVRSHSPPLSLSLCNCLCDQLCMTQAF